MEKEGCTYDAGDASNIVSSRLITGLWILLGLFGVLITWVLYRHFALERKIKRETNIPVKSFWSIWPIIGDIQIMTSGRAHQEENIPKLGNIFVTMMIGEPHVIISGHNLIEQVSFKNAKKIVTDWPQSVIRIAGERAIIVSEGEIYRKERKALVSHIAAPATLSSMFPSFVRVLQKQIDKWVEQTKDGSFVDVAPGVEAAVREAVMVFVLGDDIPRALLDGLLPEMAAFGQGVGSLPIDLPFTNFGKGLAAKAKIRDLLVAENKRRQSLPNGGADRKDIFQLIINETADDGHPEGFNSDTAIAVTFASVDTTATSSFGMIDIMCDHGKEWDLLYEETLKVFGPEGLMSPTASFARLDKELPYAMALVKESLRHGGAVARFFRRAVDEFDVVENGVTYRIPERYKIIASLYHTNNDPMSDLHRDATSFIPERYMGSNTDDKNPKFKTSTAMVTFGANDHYCPGAPMAKLMMALLVTLMSQYKWVRRERVKAWSVFPVPRPVGGIWVRATPREAKNQQAT